MKKLLGLSALLLLVTAGCSSTKAEEEGINSIKKSHHLYKWSGTKKNEVNLVNSTLDNFYDSYDKAFNNENAAIFNRSVQKDSQAEQQLKKEIKSGKYRNMVVYSYVSNNIVSDEKGLRARVGRELSNDSTNGRMYGEEVFYFEYDPALKQMMISEIKSVDSADLKVNDKAKAQQASSGNGVTIDVVSTDFNNVFLNDSSRFYGGVVKDMSMQVMKERYGAFTDHMEVGGKKYYIYGNAAVRFNEEIDEKSNGTETVQDMVIVPMQLPYQDILAFYGEPDNKQLKGKDKFVDYKGENGAVMRVHLTPDEATVDYIEKK